MLLSLDFTDKPDTATQSLWTFKYAPIELILFNIVLLCILYIQIYDLFSDHVAESKGTVWLPSFRSSPALPPPPRSFWLPSGFILKISHLWEKTIFFCDDDVEKIYVRDSTVIRDNENHRMYNEILDELGDLATVVSRNYVYGKIKDRTGLSIRHISRIINHTKVEEI